MGKAMASLLMEVDAPPTLPYVESLSSSSSTTMAADGSMKTVAAVGRDGERGEAGADDIPPLGGLDMFFLFIGLP